MYLVDGTELMNWGYRSWKISLDAKSTQKFNKSLGRFSYNENIPKPA